MSGNTKYERGCGGAGTAGLPGGRVRAILSPRGKLGAYSGAIPPPDPPRRDVHVTQDTPKRVTTAVYDKKKKKKKRQQKGRERGMKEESKCP